MKDFLVVLVKNYNFKSILLKSNKLLFKVSLVILALMDILGQQVTRVFVVMIVDIVQMVKRD
jgi:hypothetical protein